MEWMMAGASGVRSEVHVSAPLEIDEGRRLVDRARERSAGDERMRVACVCARHECAERRAGGEASAITYLEVVRLTRITRTQNQPLYSTATRRWGLFTKKSANLDPDEFDDSRLRNSSNG